MKGRVLIIAGSDSGGGAGIQADIKTVTLLGGYAATAITAITVQNTLGVTGVVGLDPAVVEAQGLAVLDDIGADAIKTGMLADSATVQVAARLIDHANQGGDGVPAVIDPVMVAKGGASLLADQAVEAVRALMIPRAALLTPNAPEAAALTGLAVEDLDGLRAAGRALLALGAKAVLMKGGHVDGDLVTDLLLTSTFERVFAAPRLQSRHTHGTGCTLASACAAGIAQNLSLEDAVDRAIAYVRGAIANAPGLGAGHGPLDHGWMLRQ